MITAVYSLRQVRGAELWLLFWLLGALAYVGGCLLFRPNRSKPSVRHLLLGLLFAEVSVDFVWALIYFPHPLLLSAGLGVVYGLALWLPALLIAAVASARKNRKNV